VIALELLFSLVIMVLLVATARYLAVQKGRSRIGWMWATAFFGPIPVLVLALLPTRLNISDKAM
jgi:hypothetical protein